MDSDVKYIKRKISFRSLEVHPTEKALVINCDVEASLVFDEGGELIEQSRECQKIIRFKSLNQFCDVDILAEEAISRSKGLLSSEHKDEIKQLISYLQKRMQSSSQTATGAKLDSFRPKTADARISSRSKSMESINGFDKNDENCTSYSIFEEIRKDLKLKEVFNEEPTINKLDEYIELLYEDYPDKYKGAAQIFYLSTKHENLIVLANNETLNLALARLLREEGRKRLELATLIVATFASLSQYNQFHFVITKYKVGVLCLDLIKLELDKEEMLSRELSEIKSMPSDIRSISSSSSFNSLLNSLHSGFIPPFRRNISSNNLFGEYDRNLMKYQLIISKQTQFLYVAFYLFIHLSEDSKIESKMVNKGIISLLLKCLKREIWSHLIVLIILFLKKLSIFAENKEQMYHLGICEKLSSIVKDLPIANKYLIVPLLELIINLSFDSKIRMELMVITNDIMQYYFKNRLNNIQIEKLIYQVLYQFSWDEKARIMFSNLSPNYINLLVNRVLEYLFDKKDCPFEELMALLINLSTNRKNTQIICDKDNLRKFLDKALTLQFNSITSIQILLLKLIRNISYHEDAQKIFQDYIEIMIEHIVSNDLNHYKHKKDDDILFKSEILFIIGNMIELPGIDWLKLVRKHHLFDWIKEQLKTDSALIGNFSLECALVIATLCSQQTCCFYLLENNCLDLLINLLNAKQEDDEIVLQIIYAFHIMLKDNEVRSKLVKDDSQVVGYLFDLVNDKNPEIKKLCKQNLDVIAENESCLIEKIRMERFKSYNKQWLEMIILREEEDDSRSLEDEDFYSNINTSNFLMKAENIITSSPSPASSMDVSEEAITKPVGRPQTAYKRRPSSRPSRRNI